MSAICEVTEDFECPGHITDMTLCEMNVVEFKKIDKGCVGAISRRQLEQHWNQRYVNFHFGP